MHTYTHIHTHTHADIHTRHTHTCIHIHTHTCRHACTQTTTHIMHAYTHMHTYIHKTYTLIHTYILTCIQRHACMYACVTVCHDVTLSPLPSMQLSAGKHMCGKRFNSWVRETIVNARSPPGLPPHQAWLGRSVAFQHSGEILQGQCHHHPYMDLTGCHGAACTGHVNVHAFVGVLGQRGQTCPVMGKFWVLHPPGRATVTHNIYAHACTPTHWHAYPQPYCLDKDR